MRTRLLLLLAMVCPFCTMASQPLVHIVPFSFVGKLIVVDAIVDGQKGCFIIDTGAPDLILNGAYFEGYSVILEPGQVRDINGDVGPARYLDVKEFQISSKTFKRQLARVIDLGHLEAIRDTPLLGVIGYRFFKNVELVMDFSKNQLCMIELDRKGNRLGDNYHTSPTDSVRLKMKSHFPYVSAFINGRKVRLGVDTGSEVNVLGKHVTHRLRDFYFPTGDILVRGFSDKQTLTSKGRLQPLVIGQIDYSETEFVSMNTLAWQAGSDGSNLDGILGQPFFRQYKTAINYRKKMLYVWK